MAEDEKGKGTPAVAPRADKDEISLDFSGVKPFDPLAERHEEDGSLQIYLCGVTNITKGQGPQGAKESVELTILAPEEVQTSDVDEDGNIIAQFAVNENDGSPRMTKAAGRKLFREYSLLPQSLPFLYEFVKAIYPDRELGEDFRFRPKEYMGQEVAVSITNETFEEQVRPRVKKVYHKSKFS